MDMVLYREWPLVIAGAQPIVHEGPTGLPLNEPWVDCGLSGLQAPFRPLPSCLVFVTGELSM